MVNSVILTVPCLKACYYYLVVNRGFASFRRTVPHTVLDHDILLCSSLSGRRAGSIVLSFQLSAIVKPLSHLSSSLTCSDT